MWTNIALTAQGLVLLAALVTDARATDLYYTRFVTQPTGGINRIDLDTLEITPVISTGLSGAYRITIDPVEQKMYWTSTAFAAAVGGVRRANLDGTDIQHIVQANGNHLGIVVDVENRRLIWSRFNQLFRANLDGTNVQPFTGLGASVIQDVTLDPVNDKIYFSDYSGLSAGRIRRMNYDGTGLETLLANIADGPVGLGVDATVGKIYWNAFAFGEGLGNISRANLDGSGVESIVQDVDADALALDSSADRIYWTTANDDATLGDVRRADSNGGNVEILPLGTFQPGGVALIPEPATFVLLGLGWIVSLRRR